MVATLDRRKAYELAKAQERAMRERGEISGIEDVGRSALTGVGEGVAGAIGLPMDAINMAAHGSDWVGRKTGLIEDTPEHRAWLEGSLQSVDDWLPTSDEALAVMNAQTKGYGLDSQGLFEHQPRTTAGKYARTMGELAPSVLSGPAGAGRKAVMWLSSSLASEGAGQLAEGTGYEDWARLGGAIVGGGRPRIKFPGKSLSTAERKVAMDQADRMVEEVGEKNLPRFADAVRKRNAAAGAHDRSAMMDEVRASEKPAREAFADLARDKSKMERFSPGQQEAVRRAGGSGGSERAARWVEAHTPPPLPLREEIDELVANVKRRAAKGAAIGEAVDFLSGGTLDSTLKPLTGLSPAWLGGVVGAWAGTGPTLSRVGNRVAGTAAQAISDRNIRSAEKYIRTGMKPGANKDEMTRLIARTLLQNQGILAGQ